MTEADKEQVLKAESDSAIERKRSKPTLVQLDNGRLVSSDGRFHPDLCGEHLKSRARKSWILVGELARIFSGSNTIQGKKHVRKMAPAVFRYLLSTGDLLIHETGTNGRIESMKLLDVTSEMELQQAQRQLERMKRNKELSLAKFELAQAIIKLHVQLHDALANSSIS